ncbi:unnamed protein product [Bathycoccus prasinos]
MCQTDEKRRGRTTTGRAGKMRPMVVFRLSFRKRILFAFAFVAFIFGTSFGRGGVSAVEVDDATKSPPSSPAHCDASVAPENGDIGNCTSKLPIGQTCRPVCADGFVLALSGKQSYCAPDGKLSYEAECVYDSCFVLERNAAQERKQKPMNEIIVHPDGKDEKTVLVSKDEREMHVEVDTMRTRAKLISYANASTNNVVVSKRLIAGGENEEEIDVEKRLTELRKKAAELRERLLRVKYRYTPPPSPPPLPPSPPPSPPSPPPPPPPSPPPSPPPLPPPPLPPPPLPPPPLPPPPHGRVHDVWIVDDELRHDAELGCE